MRLVSRLVGMVTLPGPGGGLGVGGGVVACWVPSHHHSPTAPHHPLLQGGLSLVEHILPIFQSFNLLLLLLGLLALPITNEPHGRALASPLHGQNPRVHYTCHQPHPISMPMHRQLHPNLCCSHQPAPPAIPSRVVMLAGGVKLV